MRGKIPELSFFLKEENPDIVLLGETWLKPCDDLAVPNYKTYRADRLDGRAGGVAILIKCNIGHSPLPPKRFQTLEVVSISLSVAGIGPLVVHSIYQPGSKALLSADVLSLFRGSNPTIAAGDFNSKHSLWGSRVTSKNGKILQGVVQDQNISVHAPPGPTFFRTSVKPDVLDIALSKNLPCRLVVDCVAAMSSDHDPILLTVDEEPVLDISRGKRHTNWTTFEKRVAAFTDRLGTAAAENVAELEETAAAFTEGITLALRDATSVRPFTPDRWIPPELKDLIRVKRKAQKRARQTLSPADAAHAARLARLIKMELREHENRVWRDRVESLRAADGTLWGATKALKAKHQRILPSHGPLHTPNGLCYSAEAKAEAFAAHLDDIIGVGSDAGGGAWTADDNDSDEESFLGTLGAEVADLDARPGDPLGAITHDEVSSIINGRHVNKAPGPDGITNLALRRLPKDTILLLVYILNRALQLEIFPQVWKVADVVMVPKPGKDLMFPDHYRPISLLSGLGKIAEAAILSRLRGQLALVNAVPEEQFGFRAGLSTDLQLFRLTEAIRDGMGERSTTAAVFLDVSKAFDTVWHGGLIYKLSVLGINPTLIRLIRSYLSGRSFGVRFEGKLSSRKTISSGVPQGSLLGPELFIVYMYDLPRVPGVHLAVYADDTALFTSCKNEGFAIARLQRAVESVEDWLELWRFKINAEKCVAARFTLKTGPPAGFLRVNDRRIPWSDSVRYLGVVLDRKLKFKEHIQEVREKMERSKNMILPLMCRASPLDMRSKLLLYVAIIRPIMSYCCLAYITMAEAHFKTLEVFQAKVFRLITAAPWYVRNNQIRQDLDMPGVKEYLMQMAGMAYERACSSDNKLLRDIVERSPMRHPRVQIKHPRDILKGPT